MKEPKVAIILSNYNGASNLYKNKSILYWCLSSLRKTKYSNYKVIIADAHSTDNSSQLAKKFKAEFIDLGHRGAFSEGNNFGIKYASKKYSPDYFLLLNNDVIISDPYWLSKLVKTAEAYHSGITGCQLLYPNGRIQHAGMLINYYGGINRGRGEVYKGQYDKIEEMQGVTFAVALINKKVIKQIGLLDENFHMGFEDVDYCIRARNAGFKIVYDGSIKLVHLEGFSSTNSKSDKIKEESFYNWQKNFWYLIHKCRNSQYFKGVNYLKAIAIYFLGAVLTIVGPERERRLKNIRLKDKALRRIILSLKAIKD
ncbi:MAG: glycosyltransferase family 2 protein [Caldisphaera sp.]|nr:glycosyltransferase family 2 protein [Caldisphaera sp.]